MKLVKLKINLDKVTEIKNFIADTQQIPTELFLESLDSKYRIDGKSIMGIFSLDLTQPLLLIVEECYKDKFKKYLVD